MSQELILNRQAIWIMKANEKREKPLRQQMACSTKRL
jgi:hypothetical protein